MAWTNWAHDATNAGYDEPCHDEPGHDDATDANDGYAQCGLNTIIGTFHLGTTWSRDDTRTTGAREEDARTDDVFEETWSQKVREIAKKDGAQANQDLESAAKALGYAKDELEAALQARTNLVASWKTFLTDAVATWKEYASLFQTQEKEHQERIQAAQEAFATAKTEVDETKAIVGAVIEIKDEEDELDCPPNNVTSEKITESMQFLTQSLQQFQEKAEEIHIEAQTSLKRPRLAPPERMDAAMGATDGQDGAKVSKAMSPFGAAGQP